MLKVPKKNTKIKDPYAALRKARSNCKTCWGYGLWAVGDACPMGPMDFSDGSPTKKCPECGAGSRRNMWKTSDGLVIPVKELTPAHLKNIVKHIDERGDKKTKARRMIEKEVKRREKTVKNTSV